MLADAVDDFTTSRTFQEASQPDFEGIDAGISGLWRNISITSKACNDVINQICRDRALRTTSQEPIEKSPQYKAWVKAMHGALRQRLTYGASSPSTGLVMAVLGYEECIRRLSGQKQTD